jgi:hypothetical protein
MNLWGLLAGDVDDVAVGVGDTLGLAAYEEGLQYLSGGRVHDGGERGILVGYARVGRARRMRMHVPEALRARAGGWP